MLKTLGAFIRVPPHVDLTGLQYGKWQSVLICETQSLFSLCILRLSTVLHLLFAYARSIMIEQWLRNITSTWWEILFMVICLKLRKVASIYTMRKVSPDL